MTTIQTVLGPIDESQLGVVLSHEHVLVGMGEDNHHYPWRYDWDATKATAVRELREAKAGGVGSTRGTGGMITKLHAAKIANLVGVPMVLATGKDPRIIHDIMAGENVGTLFLAKEESR